MKQALGILSIALLCSTHSSTPSPTIHEVTGDKVDLTTALTNVDPPTVLQNVKDSRDNTAPVVKGIDVFGTNQITTKQVRQVWGKQITQFAEAIYSQNPDSAVMGLRDEIVTGIRAMGDFAFVELSPILYFRDGNPIYVTVDIVDVADAKARMQFRPKPTGTFADPNRLLQHWAEYEDTANRLLRAGELRSGFKTCPALHCTSGFEHPALRKFASIFATSVPRNRDQLVQILHQDQDETHRAYAAFLLAHTNDAASYVQIAVPAIADPSSLVRNNVLRVLTQIAQNHPDVVIPINPVIQALRYPNATDRNKAAYVLKPLAKRAKYRKVLIKQTVSILLDMLKLEQPNNHDPAYAILKTLSGKQYGERDYTAWKQWAAQQALTLH